LLGLIGKVALIPIKVIARNKKYEQQHQSLTSRNQAQRLIKYLSIQIQQACPLMQKTHVLEQRF
jgi:hypothetical protein